MKRLTMSTALVSLAALSFLFGAWAASSTNWRQPLARVRIENQTGQSLKSLELHFSSNRVNGVLVLPALRQGEHVVSRIYVAGEGGYKVNAVLADGSSLKEREGYVEAGYSTSEVLQDSRNAGSAATARRQ